MNRCLTTKLAPKSPFCQESYICTYYISSLRRQILESVTYVHDVQVFARGAPFLPDISAAVLNVSESGTLQHLERSMLSSYNCSSSDETEYVHDSVGLDSFSVLFAITALTSTLALLITKFWETEEQRVLPKGPQQQAVRVSPW